MRCFLTSQWRRNTSYRDCSAEENRKRVVEITEIGDDDTDEWETDYPMTRGDGTGNRC
jgi:hypothetical protein